jgi:ribosomal protein L12E/L44/L45/RPP1/RPP2
MYNLNLKIKVDKVIVDALIKKLKYKNVEDYLNQKIKNDLMK